MQNKILKKAIEIYILLATSLIPSVLIAQSLCPPDTGTNCGPWQFSNYQTSTDNPDCNLSVFYHYRICNNVYQIYIEA